MSKVEDLLKRRFKVIADYPGNRFKIGAVFTKDIDGTYVDQDNNVTIESNLVAFPNLFKELSWYEEREEGEMPKYIKRGMDYNGPPDTRIYKANGYKIHLDDFDKEDGFIVWYEGGYQHVGWFAPATEKEYLEYINHSNE